MSEWFVLGLFIVFAIFGGLMCFLGMWISWKWSKNEPLIIKVPYKDEEETEVETDSGIPEDFI